MLLIGVLVPLAAQAAPPEPVNLAFGTEPTQSSTNNGGLAARAVDGNNHGVFSHASVSHTGNDVEAWWQVDLGSSAEITEIVLWNRTDCCSDRLSDFHVLVSDEPFTSTDLQETIGQSGVADYPFPGTAGEETRITIDHPARYVRVQLEDRNYLSLAEVEILSVLEEEGQPTTPILDVDVFVDGFDAFEAPGPIVAADGNALFTYQVTNLSDETLFGLYLWQDGIGAVPCPATKMYAGELVVCEITVDIGPGDHTASVAAEAWTGSGSQAEDSPTLYFRVEGGGPPGLVNLAFGKEATQTEDGSTVSAHPAGLAVDGNLDGDLRNGSVSMTYRVVEAYWEVDLGDIYDIDSITLWNRTDCCSQRLRNFHVLVSDEPFELDDMQYTMTQPGVLDIHHQATADRRADIEVGRTGRYVRVQAAYREAMVQMAEVQVWGTDATAPPPSTPATTELDLQVAVNGDDADGAPGPVVVPGDPITFTYEVTNSGTERLWAIYIWDDGIGHIDTCPADRLDPGESMVCVVESIAELGQYGSRVEANGWDDAGLEAYDLDAVNYLGADDGIVVGPAIDIEALVEGQDADQPPGPDLPAGSPVAFTYEVTNVGTERLWAINVWHAGVGLADCPQDTLEMGGTITCTGLGEADAGLVAADVFADAWDSQGSHASDSDPVVYTGTTDSSGPALQVQSYVNGQDADTPPGATVVSGESAEFRYEVTNTGSRRWWGLWLWDVEHGTIDCPVTSLSPGDSVTCTTTVTPGTGLHNSSILAEAWDAAGARVTDTDRHHYFVAQEGASLELEALVDGLNGWWEFGPRIRIGEVVTRSFVVTNTGTIPLTDVQVTDDLIGAVTCPRSTIMPGETLTCAVTQYTAIGKSITFAHVTADADGMTISSDERLAWHVKVTGRNEDISLDVTVNGHDTAQGGGLELPVGSTAEIRYVVTNLGTWTSFYDITVEDPNIPMSAMSCTNSQQVYLGSVVCTVDVTVTGGEYSHLIVANAFSANTPKMQASDWVDWIGIP